MSRRRRAAGRGAAQASTFKLFLVFLVLVGINAYVFFASPRSLQTVARAAEEASTRGSTWPAPPAAPVEVKPLRVREGTVREREGLGSALRRDGVAAADVDAALRALRPLIGFRRQIQAGQRYRIALDGRGALAALSFEVGDSVYGAARGPDGRLRGGKAAVDRQGRRLRLPADRRHRAEPDGAPR